MVPPSFDVEATAYPRPSRPCLRPRNFGTGTPSAPWNATPHPDVERGTDRDWSQADRPPRTPPLEETTHEHDRAQRSAVREHGRGQRHRPRRLLGRLVRTVPTVRPH